MKIIDKLVLVANLAVIFATVCSYIVPHFNPRDLGIISYTVLLYPILLIANLIFIIYWLARKSRKALFSILILLIGWGYIRSFYVTGAEAIADGSESIKVVSFNTSNFSYNFDHKLKNRSDKEEKIKEFLRSLDTVDIFCLQEIAPYSADILTKSLKSHKLYQPKKGTAIMTRYPVLDVGIIDFGTFTNSCTWADVRTSRGIIRVYSLHLESNRISADTEKMIEKGVEIEESLFHGVRELLRKYKRSSFKRADQVSQLRKHIEDCPYPIILAGDFNDTPVSYTYKQLSNGLVDSFMKAGRGVGSSYAGSIPFLRIDYIMVTPMLETQSSRVIKEKYSDHYPVSSTFYFRVDAVE